MLDQEAEAKEQQLSETLTTEELPQSIIVELSEEEQLEAVTGGGGAFSQPSQPEPLKGVLVRLPSGKLMKAPNGNLLVAIPRSLSEPPLPRPPSPGSSSSGNSSSGQARPHESPRASTNTMENIFFHVL